MGFFNVIKINTKCFNCKRMTLLTVQFKYGEDWMHNYNVGDSIIWGEKNVGQKTYKHVLVSAISEECPICGECSDYIVEVKNNIIQKIYIDRIELSLAKEGYIIIND